MNLWPSKQTLILERIGLHPDAWVTSVSHYSKKNFFVLGVIDRIKAYAQMQKSRNRGQHAVCVVIV
ncbi:MAG: hypothetical protein PVI97_04780 [Candidatus Thiodiazotropha sp.]|jgi:hypothetical protein